VANRNATTTALSTGTVRPDQAAAAVATIARQTKAATSANLDAPNGAEYGPAHQWRRSDRYPARGARVATDDRSTLMPGSKAT
jgi:hypothetical protein